MARQSFRLETHQATFGATPHMYGLPTGYELMYVPSNLIEGLEQGDEVIYGGSVYRVAQKKASSDPTVAVELLVSYERSERPRQVPNDPDWPEVIGE